MHIPCRNQVGDWANALEMYVRQQQQQAAWQPTPEGLNAFRAGRASGFADGYKAGALASVLQTCLGGACLHVHVRGSIAFYLSLMTVRISFAFLLSLKDRHPSLSNSFRWVAWACLHAVAGEQPLCPWPSSLHHCECTLVV
eukprot:scaffold15584_cov24-Tisochrysis_lutea.AAC.2